MKHQQKYCQSLSSVNRTKLIIKANTKDGPEVAILVGSVNCEQFVLYGSWTEFSEEMQI